MLRRAAPVLLVLAAGVLLTSYVLHTRRLVGELREYSRRSSILYASIYEKLSDTTGVPLVDKDGAPLSCAGAPRCAAVESNADRGVTALFEISREIMAMGVPTVITDLRGEPLFCINLPYCDPLDAERARAAAIRFDREAAPVPVHDGLLHFGVPVVVQALSILPLVQAGALVLVLVAGFVILRERGRSERQRIWAGMARESAHQIATPLSSLNGWLQLLVDRHEGADATTIQALQHMGADVERLERVAHRFERIGRPPRREPVDVAALVSGVAEYFRARVPTLAHRVQIELSVPDSPSVVQGDPVLLEWALEAVVKNAIDALAGKAGLVRLDVDHIPEGGLRVRISDSGPGVNRELRSRIFQPGLTTKEQGWGVGLALARRIVEENHGGSLTLVPSESGAIFDILLH
jgi:signal transduction histidine kinase